MKDSDVTRKGGKRGEPAVSERESAHSHVPQIFATFDAGSKRKRNEKGGLLCGQLTRQYCILSSACSDKLMMAPNGS